MLLFTFVHRDYELGRLPLEHEFFVCFAKYVQNRTFFYSHSLKKSIFSIIAGRSFSDEPLIVILLFYINNPLINNFLIVSSFPQFCRGYSLVFFNCVIGSKRITSNLDYHSDLFLICNLHNHKFVISSKTIHKA